MIAPIDFVCLSHLRWNFVYQRPNHLMSRAAKRHRVFFVEEPELDADVPRLEVTEVEPNLRRVVPHLAPSASREARLATEQALLARLFDEHDIDEHLLWYYTPMALEVSRHLEPELVVFDIMDELTAFANAPVELVAREAELLERAHVVFTGGHTLFEAKRHRHRNIHALPSSVDVAHFARARRWPDEPADQATIPHPRLGYFGVIDERMDLALLDQAAAARPDWQFVLVGPVTKIDPASLPRRPNLHYLGPKPYAELPGYLSGWDVALVPFALNESTRFISPTKTPEYLAAGRPVVSTPIRDVVRPYGELGLVKIVATPTELVRAVEAVLRDGNTTREAADAFLRDMSWDRTWARMYEELERALAKEVQRCSTI
ncbi:glycosyltransferase family 1 protein [Myxococcota bacterium]|nr:glycosyltransferase family 1 protein [Myxococcota bacterium]